VICCTSDGRSKKLIKNFGIEPLGEQSRRRRQYVIKMDGRDLGFDNVMRIEVGEISGSHGDEYEGGCVPGCCAV
jgi:hypothetical protein